MRLKCWVKTLGVFFSVFLKLLGYFCSISLWICLNLWVLIMQLIVLSSFSGKSDSESQSIGFLLCWSEFEHWVFFLSLEHMVSQFASKLWLVPIHHRQDWKEVRLTGWAVVQKPQLKASYCGSLHCCTTKVALLIGKIHQNVLFHFLGQVAMMYFSLTDWFIY